MTSSEPVNEETAREAEATKEEANGFFKGVKLLNVLRDASLQYKV